MRTIALLPLQNLELQRLGVGVDDFTAIEATHAVHDVDYLSVAMAQHPDAVVGFLCVQKGAAR